MAQPNNDPTTNVLDLISSFLGPKTSPSCTSQPSSLRLSSPSQTTPDSNNQNVIVHRNGDGGDNVTTATATTDRIPSEPSIHPKKFLPTSLHNYDERHRYQTIVFSKDRPWQLQQLLRSMRLPWPEEDAQDRCIGYSIEIVILVHVTESFREGYAMVRKEYQRYEPSHSDGTDDGDEDGSGIRLVWRYEHKDTVECSTHPSDHSGLSFATLLEQTVLQHEQHNEQHHSSPNTVTMFLTDDCVFLEPLKGILHTAYDALYSIKPSNDCIKDGNNNNGDDRGNASGGVVGAVLGFYTRLHPGISWSQTQNRVSLPPRRWFSYLPGSNTYHSSSTYHNSNNRDSSNTRDESNETTTTTADGTFLYHHRYGTGEWAYPFDLSGGTYRTSDVTALFRDVKRRGGGGAKGCCHPNTFELAGNESLSLASSSSSFSTFSTTSASVQPSSLEQIVARGEYRAVPTRSVLVVLAINRVQNVFRAPLAIHDDDDHNHNHDCDHDTNDNGDKEEEKQKEEETGYETNTLLEFLRTRKRLDLNRYRRKIFHTSHIGVVYVLEGDESHDDDDSHLHYPRGDDDENDDDDRVVALSVLLPIQTGPPQAAIHAIRSIVHQPIEEEHHLQRRRNAAKDQDEQRNHHANHQRFLSPMQIVIVDDGCKDGSVDATLQEIRRVVDLHFDLVDLVIRDHRSSFCSSVADTTTTMTDTNTTNTDTTTDFRDGRGPIHLTIDVVHPPQPGTGGIGSALNHGLKICRSEYVARMDADDVCETGRLQAQLEVLTTAKGGDNVHDGSNNDSGDVAIVGKEDRVDVLGTCSVLFVDRSGSGSGGGGNDGVVDPLSDRTTTTNAIVLPYSNMSEQGYLSSGSRDGYRATYCSLPPSEPGFVAWSLLFSCVVSHPTVVFRRSAVQGVGGYYDNARVSHCSSSASPSSLKSTSTTSRRYTEDYDLWTRLVHQNVRCVCSLPRLGLWHRKHGTKRNGTGVRKRIQKEESDSISRNAMQRLLEDCEKELTNAANDETVDVVDHRDNDGATPRSSASLLRWCNALLNPRDLRYDSDSLDGAAHLLVALERSFLTRHDRLLTRKEKALVKADCDARVGILATIALERFGRQITMMTNEKYKEEDEGVWSVWCRRNPEARMERLAMLCGTR